jgi:hypothetical protein
MKLIDPDSNVDQIMTLVAWCLIVGLVAWAFILFLYDITNIEKVTAMVLGLTAVGILFQSMLTMEMMRKRISKFPLDLKHNSDSYSHGSDGEESFLKSNFEIINTSKSVSATNVIANVVVKDKQTSRIIRESIYDKGNMPEDSRKDFVLNFGGLEDNKEYEIIVNLKFDGDSEGKTFRQRVKTGPENP